MLKWKLPTQIRKSPNANVVSHTVTPEATVTIPQDAFDVEIPTTPQSAKNPEINLPNVLFAEALTQPTTGVVSPIRIS
jgi:hypothetical protein